MILPTSRSFCGKRSQFTSNSQHCCSFWLSRSTTDACLGSPTIGLAIVHRIHWRLKCCPLKLRTTNRPHADAKSRPQHIRLSRLGTSPLLFVSITFPAHSSPADQAIRPGLAWRSKCGLGTRLLLVRAMQLVACVLHL